MHFSLLDVWKYDDTKGITIGCFRYDDDSHSSLFSVDCYDGWWQWEFFYRNYFTDLWYKHKGRFDE